MCVQKTTINHENEPMKQVKKYRMEIYFPDVYDTIEVELTPEQVQMYNDFIQAEREKYEQSPDTADYDWESWLRDAFLLNASFTYPILLAGEELTDAEVHFVDLEHPIEE